MTLRRNLQNIPKVTMLSGITPLYSLPNLSKHLGLKNIYIKRDDEGGYGGGGNKIRKFEYLFSEIISRGFDTIILPAHSQSNAARELVASAARYGIDTIIVTQPSIKRHTRSFLYNGNYLLLDILGASIIEAPIEIELNDYLNILASTLKDEGKKPYVMPFGASNTLGAIGYVSCADELLTQSVMHIGSAPDFVIVPTGSGGTHAGIAAGLTMLGAETKVLGFSVLKSKADSETILSQITTSIYNKFTYKGKKAQIFVDDTELGDGYGHVTQSCIDAIRMTAQLEGIFLDPVYSGKAMAGLISYARSGGFKSDDIIVFLHTGGSQLLHAYSDIFIHQ